jgi:hypothetical protein
MNKWNIRRWQLTRDDVEVILSKHLGVDENNFDASWHVYDDNDVHSVIIEETKSEPVPQD